MLFFGLTNILGFLCNIYECNFEILQWSEFFNKSMIIQYVSSWKEYTKRLIFMMVYLRKYTFYFIGLIIQSHITFDINIY